MFNVVIIGLGNVGARNSVIKTLPQYKRNHLEAILKFKELNLVKLVDKDPKSFNKINKYKFDKELFTSNLKELRSLKIDLIVISTPTSSHKKIISECMDLKPRLIICEKPLTEDIVDDHSIINMLQNKRIKLIVNYQRRFESNFRQLKKILIRKEINKIVFRYGKGFLNYATHFIDFLISCFGKVKRHKIINFYKNKKDYDIDVCIEFKDNLKVFILSFQNLNYDVFEFEIYDKNSKIEVLNGGVELRYLKKQKSLIYKNYNTLNSSKISMSDYGDGFENLYRRSIDFLENKDTLSEFNSKDQKYFSSLISSILNKK